MIIHNVSALCKNCKESINHLFLSCLAANDVWNGLIGHVERMDGKVGFDSPKSLLLNWPKLNNRGIGEASWCILPYTIFWGIWSVRNEIIFDNATLVVEDLIKRVKCTVWA
ncbi:hypothetical protein AQUCO_00600030v1 [Aquilegia coerulea]|uniref:Reverse transcriptase zinc-binding domain-containing protein n=1 Tax=Aquilegia coerulea TaxID=218851 RepID=A0A2G5EMV2_AQUCA|nr:hypothetical protein AQUCO_00600030v1 [Aquilegia coerulea]